MATPRNEIEKGVEKYLFTYQQEVGPGNAALHPHFPANPYSVVTMSHGKVINLGQYKDTAAGKERARRDLIRSGFKEEDAEELLSAIGLRGEPALEFAKNHKDISIKPDSKVGVTVGPGKDLGYYKQTPKGIEEGYKDLLKIGFSIEEANALRPAISLKGEPARQWVEKYGDSITLRPELLPQIFNELMKVYQIGLQNDLNKLVSSQKINLPLEKVQLDFANPDEKTEMLMDFKYNLGNLLGHADFVENLINGNWKGVEQEYIRKGPDGPLKERNEKFYENYIKPHLDAEKNNEAKHDPDSTQSKNKIQENLPSPNSVSGQTEQTTVILQPMSNEITVPFSIGDVVDPRSNLRSTEKISVGLTETEKVYEMPPQHNDGAVPAPGEDTVDTQNNLESTEKPLADLPEIEKAYDLQPQNNESVVSVSSREEVDPRSNLGSTEKISAGLTEIEKVYEVQPQHNESVVAVSNGEATDAHNYLDISEKCPVGVPEIEKVYELQPQNEERQSVPFQTNEPATQQDVYNNGIGNAPTDLSITQNEKETVPVISQEVSENASIDEKSKFEVAPIEQIQESIPSITETLPSIEYKIDLNSNQPNIQTENISVEQVAVEPIAINTSPEMDTYPSRESVQTIERISSGDRMESSSSPSNSTSSSPSSSDGGGMS